MIIKIGHNEAIMKQYLLTKKQWRGPNGETALVPKDEGLGIMISAMMSREFGWGIDITKQQLEKVNKMRNRKQKSTYQHPIHQRIRIRGKRRRLLEL